MNETSVESPMLVVDDDSAILRILDRYFTKKGHNILVASSVEDALTIFKQNSNIMTILSDLKMPGLDGDDLVKEIRDLGSDIPVYIMTGFPEDQKVARLHQYGVTDILIKPLDLDTLEKRIFS